MLYMFNVVYSIIYPLNYSYIYTDAVEYKSNKSFTCSYRRRKVFALFYSFQISKASKKYHLSQTYTYVAR